MTKFITACNQCPHFVNRMPYNASGCSWLSIYLEDFPWGSKIYAACELPKTEKELRNRR